MYNHIHVYEYKIIKGIIFALFVLEKKKQVRKNVKKLLIHNYA